MTFLPFRPVARLQGLCVLSCNLVLLLIGVLTLAAPAAQAQYSTTELINSSTFPTDTNSAFNFGSPIATGGAYVAYSTSDAVWSQPIAGGAPKKLFSVGTTLPGSSTDAVYIYGQVALSQGIVVFIANGGSGLFGIYSVAADGSAAAMRVADSGQVAGASLWSQAMNVYGVYGFYQVSNGVVVFSIAGSLYEATIGGKSVRTIWQTEPKPGFQGCSTAGQDNNIFLSDAAYQPATNGTEVVFGASSYLDFAGLYKGAVTADDACGELTNSGLCNICGNVSTLPGQPQPGIAWAYLGGQAIQIDGDDVYFGVSAGNGVSQGVSYTGYFKIPLAGGKPTPVVTTTSHVPGLTNADGSFAQVTLYGFAVNNGKFVFLAQDAAGNDPTAFYMVDGTSYTPLFTNGTSVNNQCVGSLEYGNLAGLNSPALSSTGQLVFSAEVLATTPPDQTGSCNDFFRFQPIGYFVVDTTHPLIPTETTITTTPATGITPNTPVTVNIAVGDAAGASNPKSLVPTGKVNVFFVSPQIFGVQMPGSLTLDADGKATLSVGKLSPAQYTFTVSYGGDSNFSSGISNAVTFDTRTAVAVKLTASATNIHYGVPVTFTAKVSNSANNSMNGTVSFLDGATVMGTVQISSTTDMASFTTSFNTLPSGTNVITAVYNGDSEDATGTSNAIDVAVAPRATSTTVLTGLATSTYGTSNALTATVTGTKGGAVPTGTVQFANGTAVYGTVTLNSAGVATLNSGSLPIGTDTVTATYEGDATYALSTSKALTTKVTQATPAVVVTSSVAKPTDGESVTLTATVTGPAGALAPTGTVNFLNKTTSLGSGTLTNGVATLTTASLPVGADSITAAYQGDANYKAVTSKALSLSDGAAPTKTAISSSALTAMHGRSVTFTATVTAVGTTLVPAGSVTFKNGTATLGTEKLNTNGVATLSTDVLTVGTHTITASYVVSTDFAASSASLTETITEAPAAAPTFKPAAGAYAKEQSVTLADTTPGAVIYYTLNGTTPSSSSTKYTAAIKVAATETIQAIAIASGYTQSAVASATYYIAPATATPVFSPKAGTYSASQSIEITDATSGAVIYYTVNGSTPTASSTKYTGMISVTKTTTIKTIAIAPEHPASAVASGTFTIK